MLYTVLVGRVERALEVGNMLSMSSLIFKEHSTMHLYCPLDGRSTSGKLCLWTSAMTEQCTVIVSVGQTLIRVAIQRGLTQGDGLSPTCLLVADSLLCWLTKQGVFAQGFADDGVVLTEYYV